MKLTTYNWKPATFRNEFVSTFDTLFDDVIRTTFPSLEKELGVGLFGKASYPKVDIIEEPDKIKIQAEIPGLTKDDVKLEINDGVLTIRGEKQETQENKDTKKTYLYKELKHSSFARSFSLNDNMDTDKINAKFENGILDITIPKKEIEPPKVKQIDIK